VVFGFYEKPQIKRNTFFGITLNCAVTVGICVKNGSTSILNALGSVMAQDFPHEQMEVIVVDDGSEDNTLSLVKDYASKMDVQLTILHHSWRGVGESRNIIAKNAQGKYIIWVDSDMTLPVDHVQKQFEFMEADPKIGVAKAVYGLIPNMNLVAALENMSFVAENTRYECGTGGSIYRTEALRQAGYFDGHLRLAGEDHDTAAKINSAGWLLERSPAVFYEQPRTSWRKLWGKYFNWGYGLHAACQQNRNLVVLYEMLPLAGLLGGLKRSVIAYKLTGNKKSFLLPIQFFYKLSAWCLGYTKGYIQYKTKNRI
jgi:glycosyltransferase involved in cell wall biosynthesis